MNYLILYPDFIAAFMKGCAEYELSPCFRKRFPFEPGIGESIKFKP